MRKNIRLLGLLAEFVGVALLLVAYMLGFSILPIIAFVVILADIICEIVYGWINETPTRIQHNEATSGTRLDGYIHEPK